MSCLKYVDKLSKQHIKSIMYIIFTNHQLKIPSGAIWEMKKKSGIMLNSEFRKTVWDFFMREINNTKKMTVHHNQQFC